MKFIQYYLDCLSHASYLIADETTGRAVVVDPQRDVAQYLIELYLRFPPDRETGLALRRYDEMLCQTYPHIAAMMTNKNTRLLRAGRYLPYRTLSAWARGKQSNGGIL